MKVAILGYGIEGKSAEQYFARKKAEIEIFDKFTEADIDGFDLGRFDLVIRTPSVRPRPGWTSATKIFFDKCPCPIIGVTGTKGKGTTASLIASILEAAGKKTYLIGNIGISPLDVLDKISKNDIVVFELSSFQLWDLEKSPHVAVLAHMDVDHLDIHRDETEYWSAKANLVRYQTKEDFIIYEKSNPISAAIAKKSPAQKLTYPTGKYRDLILSALQLPGPHNMRNAEAAILAAKCFNVTDPATIKKGLAAFTGLPHRLKFVRKVHGVEYYDDSISTTPGSTIAAITAFPTRKKILILGGSSKGADYTELAKTIKSGSIKLAILVGPESHKIRSALAGAHFDPTIQVLDTPYDMAEVVKLAAQAAENGEIVILSPAAASFDSFKNYADRGDQFIAAVEAI